jgi:predicted component of type VI protein secretion system
MLQAELKILGGKHQGKTIPLTTKKFLVGREADCQLRPNSDLVSRHHCVFLQDDYSVRLRDLGSTNGTQVNGEPVHGEVMLKTGDQIVIGKLELEMVIRQVAAVAAPPMPAAISPGDSTLLPTSDVPGEPPVDEAGAESQSALDTSYEMQTYSPQQDPGQTVNMGGGDTTIYPGMPPGGVPVQMGGYPGYPNYPMMPGYPPGYGMPPGYPMPGYPPGYGMPQMGYPQGMPYPQQQYPQQMYPGAAPQQPTAPAQTSGEMEIKLPPPEETGIKAPPPPAPVAPPVEGQAAPPEKPSTAAADIIRQHLQRRGR